MRDIIGHEREGTHSPLTQTIDNLLGQSSDHWFHKIISDKVWSTFIVDDRITIYQIEGLSETSRYSLFSLARTIQCCFPVVLYDLSKQIEEAVGYPIVSN